MRDFSSVVKWYPSEDSSPCETYVLSPFCDQATSHNNTYEPTMSKNMHRQSKHDQIWQAHEGTKKLPGPKKDLLTGSDSAYQRKPLVM